jgi:hypothetical protein
MHHKWWLALIAASLMPWPGPHLDAYLPLGWVLYRATSEATSPGFWMIAGVLSVFAYAVWVLLLGVLLARLMRRGGGAQNNE